MAGSLSDISKLTGLGVTTVSEILRDKPGYREETRQVVREAARKLNYRPNLMARSLKQGCSHTIGVIVGSLHTPITSAKLSEIELSAREAGYTAFVTRGTMDDPGGAFQGVEQLLSRQVDGLIVMQPLSLGQPAVERLLHGPVPVVFVEWAPPDAPWQVVFRKETAMRAAADHLAKHGHRQGIFLCTPSDWLFPHLKFEAWQQAAAKASVRIEMDPAFLLKPSDHYEAQTYDLIRQRAAEGILPPLLLMNNDACAVAAIAALTDAGISVPEQISLVGFDDTLESRYCRPSLSTIHQPRTEIGHTAFAMLLQAMKNEAQGGAHVVDFRFIQRNSTGPVPVSHQG